jgi:hypothetical protein
VSLLPRCILEDVDFMGLVEMEIEKEEQELG